MLFLLYIGPIVLKGLLRKTEYNHFLLLHIACRLLCTESKAIMYVENVKEYLRAFCASSQEIYGEEFAVINVHNLIHLADDVRNMNNALINISAYSFENYLGMIKKVLCSPNRPLAQLCRRLHENNEMQNILKPTIPSIVEYRKKGKNNVRYNISDITYIKVHY